MAMVASGSPQFNVFEFYRMYCEITSGSYACGMEGYNPDDESLQGRCSREALNKLLMLINSTVHPRMSIFDEILKLMSTLDLIDFSEFSRFYDFVFFMCRENGQKNITVGKAVTSWRLVLPGRFRLLNHWCNFVEKNQRHNVSEDTWKQVLAFSRCVHENLEGYDPEGAWPVLIDDFVDHMYRIMGTNSSNLFCSCGDSETQQFEESRSGLRMLPGAKRKNCHDFQMHGMEPSDNFSSSYILLGSKRRQANENPAESESNDVAEAVKHNGLIGCCPKSPCAVEGSLSKGFASLFSGHSCLQFDTERRVSFT